MKIFLHSVLAILLSPYCLLAQEKEILDKGSLQFLEEMTAVVMDSSRILPGQRINAGFGPNTTGGTLIRPGGRDSYPSFWIRDYAMSLESGMVPASEQQHMLWLTAATQCDQAWITKNGSMVPTGAIADHIRIDDSQPIFFPGTYSFEEQGNREYGMMPPYDDQFFFIHMAYYYLKSTRDLAFLSKEINGVPLIDRLETAFKVPPSRKENQIVYTTDDYRGVDFGFRDAIVITGDLCFTSILKFKAANELAEIFSLQNNRKKSGLYKGIATALRAAIPGRFLDQRGMLLASTGKCRQADVWATALAVYYGVLVGDTLKRTSQFLANAYKNGSLSLNGNIRHVLTGDDFNPFTPWEVTQVGKNTYQNGAYWGTPTGWVCYTIYQTDPKLARQLANEYVSDLQKHDFRKGNGNGAPYECFYPPAYKQNPVYLTTVSCPYAVFKSMTTNLR